MLKLVLGKRHFRSSESQPPSGGCVLKLHHRTGSLNIGMPAAFGRLCVETNPSAASRSKRAPAAFGRLCVETNLVV